MIVPSNFKNPVTYDECVSPAPWRGLGPAASPAARSPSCAGAEGTAGDIWVGIFRR